jgi:DNA-directed RNA polymerase specialized sigma24 family protein
MPKQVKGQTAAAGRIEVGPLEGAFQALPPLDSSEYLEYIRGADKVDLPPEVLVRAFRQLPPESKASKATLQRLFQRRNNQWDYFVPLVAFARRQSKKAKRGEYEDLLQDALRQIVQSLPTARGQFAERSWHAYCRRELSEAWRQRYGRRGERFPPEEPLTVSDPNEGTDVMSLLSAPPPWHGTVQDTCVPRIEEIARRVLGEIEDEFVRAVAQEAWFKKERPNISGRSKPGEDPPLTTIFPGNDRFKITRALRHADSQLAAALLAETGLVWSRDIRALLERLKEKER